MRTVGISYCNLQVLHTPLRLITQEQQQTITQYEAFLTCPASDTTIAAGAVLGASATCSASGAAGPAASAAARAAALRGSQRSDSVRSCSIPPLTASSMPLPQAPPFVQLPAPPSAPLQSPLAVSPFEPLLAPAAAEAVAPLGRVATRLESSAMPAGVKAKRAGEGARAAHSATSSNGRSREGAAILPHASSA